MTETSAETRSVVVEREIPYPPEKIWRALTQPHLIEDSLIVDESRPLRAPLTLLTRYFPRAHAARKRYLVGP